MTREEFENNAREFCESKKLDDDMEDFMNGGKTCVTQSAES